ncbi:MAG: hypothetical protein ABIF19_17085 [Planctomycetota bacterium]
MTPTEALDRLYMGAHLATMVREGAGKRVVTDGDRAEYSEAATVLRTVIDNQGEKQDGPTAGAGHDHECPQIRDDVREGEGQGERPGFSGLGESASSGEYDQDGVDPVNA